ncbi:MAG: hypothetical protein B6U72_06655 [Candidatus Altiarchaeales archaeon ex4484_2]|nr:MAG: hypothetical protein B6U72_06655 [Candidatus Altiarchaeales archaeon ex4484_2]
MKNPFATDKIKDSSMAFKSGAERLSVAFPELHWELKRAGFDMDAIQYIAVTLLVTFSTSIFILGFVLALIFVFKVPLDPYIGAGMVVMVTVFSFFYVLLLPKLEVKRREKRIDGDLDYMLKDMEIQLTAGLPLFNSIESIAEGNYGACSEICGDIVRDVESGNSIKNVLNDYGITSASAYLRRTLWQISNAIQTGSNIKTALEAITVELQREKEDKIESYGKELSLWGLIYMLIVIVAPSMGITLLLIMSSFLGGSYITDTTFWLILAMLVVGQIFFLYLIRSKRPNI